MKTLFLSLKLGIFSADFEEENNTWVELGDGENMTLDCRVFLKQEKTVRKRGNINYKLNICGSVGVKSGPKLETL